MTVTFLQIYEKLYKAYGPQHWWPATDGPFEVIIGAILTQNTAWSNVEKAIRSLKAKRLLSIRALKGVSKSKLALAIRSSGFFNVKARRLKSFMTHLSRHHHDRLVSLFASGVQNLRDELLGIDGIGPETADSIVLYAANKPVFVVDAYTRRIFKRLGFLSPPRPRPNDDYHSIQKMFQDHLPKKTSLYNEYHALIVRHAKEYCRKRPVCSLCPLEALCPKLIES